MLDANPDIYANPPSLSKTLFSPASSPGAGERVEDGSGASQSVTLVAALGVFALVGVFVFTEFSPGGGGGGGGAPSQVLCRALSGFPTLPSSVSLSACLAASAHPSAYALVCV